MPNEKIRHGIACTMLHQFCTVQLSIIKSWLCFVFDVRCSSTSRERPKQYIKREIPHAGHHFAGLGNKDSSSTAVGASGFGGIAWSSVCCASVSMFHHCYTPRQCCFFTVLLMLLDKVREDASGVTDIKIRNLFLTQVLLPQWRLEFEDFDNGNGAAWQNAFDDWVIEQFWCPQFASLQVDLQIALKKVSRCWQPKQMRGWESRQLELDHVVIWHGGGVLVQKPQL